MVRLPLDLVLTVLVLCGALVAVQLVILTFEIVRLRRDLLRAIAFFAAAVSGGGWRGHPVVDEWGDDEPTAPGRRFTRSAADAGLELPAPWWGKVRAFWRRLFEPFRE